MSAAALHVWTMRTGAVEETPPEPFIAVLDAAERERAARFRFPHHRAQFVAAHALARAALSRLHGPPPAAWCFVADAQGKPAARLGEVSPALSFSLSHTAGMAGVAALADPDCLVGFDVEAASRAAAPELARRFFAPEETAWLETLPSAERRSGFLRLWTLKEAFVKARGHGLGQDDLASFRFAFDPLRIRCAPDLAEREANWRFEQRLLDGGFVAAVAIRCGAEPVRDIRWTEIDPLELAAGLSQTGFP